MVKAPTRDELVEILTTSHRSIIREADEWRPLASYILGLHALLTKETLLRLKRRIGRDRARYAKLEREAMGASKERAFGETNVCDMTMGFIDEEIRKCNEVLNHPHLHAPEPPGDEE